MKKILFLCILSLGYIGVRAQDNSKTTIVIIPGSINNDDENVVKYAPRLVSVLSSVFQESKRFSLLSTDNWGMPQDATEAQYTSQAKDLGVNFIVTGSVEKIPITNHPNFNQYGAVVGYTYSAKVFFSIKLINVETGTSSTKSFEDGSGFFNMMNTESAVNNAINKAGTDVKKWANEAFPVNVGLVKIIKKDDKGGALSVLISAGSSSGVSEGKGRKNKPTRFKIVEYISETVDGKIMKRTVQIGSAEIDKVDDDNFSECIVTDGRKEVASKVDAGTKLFLITIN
jgi:hypothetical protein